MLLTVHTDASYLSEAGGKSHAAGHFYLTNQNNKNFNNGAVLTLSAIIKHVMSSASKAELSALYEINPSLELSLLPYVEMYRGSTYFFASQLMTQTVLVGSWWPGGLGSYRLPRRRYDPTKHTSPNYRPWVMSPMYGLVRFYRRAICDARHPQSKNVPIRNMRESDLLEVILP